MTVGHILDIYAGPATYEGRVIWPLLLLHNIPNKLSQHIYAYADTPQLVSRLYRHIRALAGILIYAGLDDTLIFWPDPPLVNPT
jgi:hypothetical protein